jgi:hypothetical protein
MSEADFDLSAYQVVNTFVDSFRWGHTAMSDAAVAAAARAARVTIDMRSFIEHVEQRVAERLGDAEVVLASSGNAATTMALTALHRSATVLNISRRPSIELRTPLAFGVQFTDDAAAEHALVFLQATAQDVEPDLSSFSSPVVIDGRARYDWTRSVGTGTGRLFCGDGTHLPGPLPAFGYIAGDPQLLGELRSYLDGIAAADFLRPSRERAAAVLAALDEAPAGDAADVAGGLRQIPGLEVSPVPQQLATERVLRVRFRDAAECSAIADRLWQQRPRVYVEQRGDCQFWLADQMTGLEFRYAADLLEQSIQDHRRENAS